MRSKKSARRPNSEPHANDDEGDLLPLRRATNLKLGVRFVIGDVPFVLTELSKDGRMRLTATVGAMSLRFTPTELFDGIRKGEVRPWGRPDTPRRRLPYLDYDKLTEEETTDVRRKVQYVMPLAKLGKISYRREGSLFQSVIDGVALAIGDSHPPSPTTVYDWLREFRNDGCDPQAFARKLLLRRPRGPRNSVAAEIIDAAILSLYEKGKAAPTNAEIHELANKRYRAYLAAEVKRAKAAATPDSESSK